MQAVIVLSKLRCFRQYENCIRNALSDAKNHL